ncbi:Leucine--tRNA ligase [Phycisphaerae bacterium RAS2]|nr:Leucine--tRNA ligase [Phycisphaerae bacterium RAS2]
MTMPADYDPAALQSKWQRFWDEHKTFRTPNPGQPGFDPSRPKFYVLDMFPYPSGAGLHVGHPEGYTATDIIARYKRMRGFNVLHPMGWDAFGLPAEQHAIETGEHPAICTKRNVDTFRRQLKMLGFSYDWDREISTTHEDYYRWTQWIFLQLFNSWYDAACEWTDAGGRKTIGRARPISELPIPDEVRAAGDKAVREYVDSQRLAYLAEVPVNWCPALGTVLSNEEVTNEGRSERGNHPVFKRPLKQWMLRITKYGDRLENDLEELAWPESVKIMQRNWIGRSEGAQVRFALADHSATLEIFTTRPDTLFGATYMVLAPEHPLVERITTAEHRAAVQTYCNAAKQKSDLARTADAKEKTGVFTGAYAINPVNDARIPIWVADYVLISYGTGAIMAVPAHDQRDFEFAKQFKLPIVAVVKPPESWLRQQVISGGVDMAYARAVGRERQAEILMNSAASAAATVSGVTVQNAQALLDGDAGWLQQVAEPSYLADPGLFYETFVDDGAAIHSGEFDGLPTAQFKRKIIAWLESRGLGRGTVNYKLRDWLFSRQRYWGEPFPILHGPDGEIVPLDESELPLTLPPMDDFRPTVSHEVTSGQLEASVGAVIRGGPDEQSVPEPPLGRAKQWATVTRNGKTYHRELNTMPQWAGSCWYYLRFLDARNEARFCGSEAERYWMVSPRKDGTPHIGGIDLYLGGAEHAVLHLLYARFWHKVLFDLGHVSTPEPFGKLFNQGMIRAFAYRDARDVPHAYDEIDFRDDGTAHLKAGGEKLSATVEKMSKSLKNVINPEDVVGEYGADSLRLYEMFMGPLEASKPWNPRDVPGVFRFLQRVWRLMIDRETGAVSSAIVTAGVSLDASNELERHLHRTTKKVADDIDNMAFNTAIAAMMEWVNAAYKAKQVHQSQAERFVLILAPFAPHIAEELWERLRSRVAGDKGPTSLAYESWPAWDAAMVVESEVEIPVQINGKLVTRMKIAKDATEDSVRTAALADAKVKDRIGTSEIAKTVYVSGRMLNLVVK